MQPVLDNQNPYLLEPTPSQDIEDEEELALLYFLLD
jgi:hypothetical protein